MVSRRIAGGGRGVARPGAVALALLGAAGLVGAEEALQKVESRPGVTQAFLLIKPPGAPAASLILFAGGPGRLKLSDSGIGWGKGNFLVRMRQRFADEGFLVAVVDAPSDQMDNERMDYRTSEANARDIAAVIAYLRKAAPVPVWLVGTSAGTLSAANAAARLKQGGADGLVLTSTITRSSRVIPQGAGSLPLKEVAVPTLFVHHKDDGCIVTPYSDIAGLMKDFKRAPKVDLITIEGGAEPRSEPCEAMSHHGYIGQDTEVVAAIAKWIKAAPASR